MSVSGEAEVGFGGRKQLLSFSSYRNENGAALSRLNSGIWDALNRLSKGFWLFSDL